MTTLTAAFQVPAAYIGCYRIQRLIGRGRASRVYLASDPVGAHVALKVPEPGAADPDEARRRLAAEYALLARLRDPRIVRVHPSHGAGAGAACLVMEHVPGGQLLDLMRTRLAPERVVRLLRDAAQALAAVHAAGLVHRDVAPGNLLVRHDGALVLADFGIAARVADDTAAPSRGALWGTVGYTAPEQLEGARPSPEADVYALGVLLHHMLCGRAPFVGATALEVAAQHLVAPVPRLPARLARWQPTIDRLLHKRPQHRPRDGGAVLLEIEHLAAAPESVD